MSRRCELTGKGVLVGHKVSHSNIKTRKFQEPNLQEVRASVNGRTVRVRVCTRCIRSGKITKAA